jgi:hypothetical protein
MINVGNRTFGARAEFKNFAPQNGDWKISYFAGSEIRCECLLWSRRRKSPVGSGMTTVGASCP